MEIPLKFLTIPIPTNGSKVSSWLPLQFENFQRFKMIWSLISVGSLPTTSDAYDEFYGATALPSISGNGAYLQCRQYFYELSCTSSSCDWNVMEQQLKRPVQFAVMMYLPTDYTNLLFPTRTLYTCWIKITKFQRLQRMRNLQPKVVSQKIDYGLLFYTTNINIKNLPDCSQIFWFLN